jgi:hypothetical protein
MPTTKLTLSADKDLVARAKKLAKRQGTSLSSMFARFLRTVIEGRPDDERPGPITRKASGLVKLPENLSDRELLGEALAERYERRR